MPSPVTPDAGSDQALCQLPPQEFVEAAYWDALGRAPDPAGHRHYLERLQQGVSTARVLQELRSSAEAKRRAATIAPPAVASPAVAPPVVAAPALPRDDGALPSVAKRRPNGPVQDSVLAALLECPPSQFVDRAYRLVLRREPDDSGRRNVARQMATGVSRLEILRQLLESDEARSLGAEIPELRAAIAASRVPRVPGMRLLMRLARMAGRRASKAVGAGRPRRLNAARLESMQPLEWRAPDAPRRDGTMNEFAEHSEAGEGTQRNWASRSAGPATIRFDRFVGPTAHGASRGPDGSWLPPIVELGGRTLGRLDPAGEAEGGTSGGTAFAAPLGGVLQYAALEPEHRRMTLSPSSEGAASIDVEVGLERFLAEALTFSPLRSMLRGNAAARFGQPRSLRLTGLREVTLLVETAAPRPDGPRSLNFDAYQASPNGELTRVARVPVQPSGQVATIEFRIREAGRPVLIVLTDERRAIVATDCIPLPLQHAADSDALLDYHVTLESGKPAFVVAAKLARTQFDSMLRPSLADASAPRDPMPSASRTLIVFHGHSASDPDVPSLLARNAYLARTACWLRHDGRVSLATGTSESLQTLLASGPFTYVLFVDAETTLRADFWAVLGEHAHRFAGDEAPHFVSWHSIWIDGSSRPCVVKPGVLLDPRLTSHRVFPTRAALVGSESVREALVRDTETFRSGRFALESAFAHVAPERALQVPIVMATVRVAPRPPMHQRLSAEGHRLPAPPSDTSPGLHDGGISVIVNYRDGVPDTLRCLESLHDQTLGGEIELVLVNNGSTPESVDAVLGRAHMLFGADRVKAIDYDRRFNHSDQCNVAALAARHDTLCMLSNDSVMRTPAALGRAAALAQIPWVGSVGFRVVGNEAAKGKLQSLGLALNERRFLFSGGSPVTTGLPPAFALDYIIETIGNTFAAAVMRRDVYRSVGGLDARAFPTNYNDIDYCFRATERGFRHLAIGAEWVEHLGRGSREADQDLPIDARIIERAPRLDRLTRVGFQSL
jgi:GT2 family glycosyltransferase